MHLICLTNLTTISKGFMIDEPLLFPYLGERVGTRESIIGLPVRNNILSNKCLYVLGCLSLAPLCRLWYSYDVDLLDDNVLISNRSI